MFKDDSGTLWFIPPDDIIDIDKEKLMKIINDYSVQPNILNYSQFGWASDVSDEADGIFYEIIRKLESEFKTEVALSITDNYNKKLPLSIKFEVFKKLLSAPPNNLYIEEMPLLKEFLNTPPGQELAAWEKWNHYWANRPPKPQSVQG